jgi:outer membrane murein-binding lipoprotein Lpp
MNTRRLVIAIISLTAALLAGCSSFVQNLTPARFEANASDIYTFRVKVDEKMRNVIKGTMKVELVTDGKSYKMKPDPVLGKYVWMYELQVPSNVSTIPYYFVLNYQSEGNSGPVNEKVYSTEFTPEHKTYTSTIANRYVAQISSSRGPVGSTIGILGQGFTNYDKVVIGDVEAPTVFVSHSQLNFSIPPIPAGKTYVVSVRTGDGDLTAGRLRVDAATIGVQPTALSLGVGDSVPLTFFIDGVAPAGGLLIEVTTDIPNSIVMPVVVIPAGQRSVSVTIQGAAFGSGYLWISQRATPRTSCL